MRRFVNGDEMDLEITGARLSHDGEKWFVHTSEGSYSAAAANIRGDWVVSFRGNQYTVTERGAVRASSQQAGSGELRATMPGQVVDVRVAFDQMVSEGETVLVIEAMKTQQPLKAPFAGRVTELNVTKGQQIAEGNVLAVVSRAGNSDD